MGQNARTKTMSMAGVVASTGGAISGATLVLLGATLAIANPQISGEAKVSREMELPGYTTHDLDLPVLPPVYGAQDDGSEEEKRWKKHYRLTPPPERPEPKPGDDPSDEPPPVFFGEEIPADTQSIVYVIDQSGSMSIMVGAFQDENGDVVENGSRMDRAKSELRRSIASLPESFRFNVIAYDECVSSCWNQTVEASQVNKDAAFAWIEHVQPDGWTNTGLATATALADKSNGTIVLLSDGAPNFMDCTMSYVGSYDQHRELIRTENTQGARIDAFGIGISSDPEARAFMQSVAADSGGTYKDVQ